MAALKRKMLSNKEFLKSVEGKLLHNKRKAEPDMRMEVLLGCTSKRIRREIRFQDSSSIAKREQEITNGDMLIERSLQKLADFRSSVENNNQINMFWSETYDWNDLGLVDDPSQVESFLRQVESQPPNTNNTTSKEERIETATNLPASYSFVEKSITLTDPALSTAADIDLGILCANFENLYEELLDSLVSVEKWMNMASNQNSEKQEKRPDALSQDHHEIMMDLSKVLGI